MHQVVATLLQAWHRLDQASTPAPPEVIQRSLAIVLQLKPLCTDECLKQVLSQLQQQLELAHLQQLLTPLGVKASAENTPWLSMTAHDPMPSILETLGSPWRQSIQRSKDQPHQRLALALQMLPYSTAFSEAALALRAILREKNADTSAALQLLYWLAALYSFIAATDEAPNGAKVASAISGAEALALSISYADLGTEALSLLNATDKKLIENTWGTANQQQSLHSAQPKAWHSYQEKLNSTI